MASSRPQKWGSRAMLAADAGVLTAAAVGLALEPGTPEPGALGFLGSVLLWVGMAALVLVPLLAWWLHGRHVDGTATLGAVLGFVAGAAVVYGLLFVWIGLGALSHAFVVSGGNVPIGVVILEAVLVAAYLTAMVWLDVDALRDLSRKRRAHVLLDVLRLLATAAYVAVVVGLIAWTAGRGLASGVDRVPILVFLWGPGVVGAATAIGADLLVRRHELRSHTHLQAGA